MALAQGFVLQDCVEVMGEQDEFPLVSVTNRFPDCVPPPQGAEHGVSDDVSIAPYVQEEHDCVLQGTVWINPTLQSPLP